MPKGGFLMTHKPLFTGVCTALVTPFDSEDRVDYAALRALIARQITCGVPALLACGTTGESSTLTEDEWRQVLACAIDAARGCALVIAGTGTNCLRHTVARARTARLLGADAQLVVTPYYNKTTQAGLVDYYARVAEAADLPMLLYNVPARTGLNLLPETAARLAEIPRVVGVKEAGGSLNQIAALVEQTRLPVYCGSDEWTAPALRLGAVGVISVLSNLLPEAMMQLFAAAQKGCFGAASARQLALRPLIEALFCETSPAPIKAALALEGLCGDAVRSPLVRVQPETRARLQALLAEARP